MAVRSIEGKGAADTTVSDGDAITRVEANPNQYSAVILDVVMPMVGGLNCNQRLKEVAPALPVIFSSGYASEANLGEIGEINITEFLLKPYRKVQLDDILRRTLQTNCSR